MVLFVVAVAILAVKTRFYALKAQDRVVRLEERERLAGLLPELLRGKIGEVSEGQLVTLRFASDTEPSGLVQETMVKKLSKAGIKRAIKNGRADYFRV